MKNTKSSLFIISLLFALIFSSCYTPSPLYGTWADNEGNTIQFMSDGTFTATITDSQTKLSTSYEGQFTVIDNVIVFNISGDSEYSRNTEWDMRGAILYLTWTAKGITKNLTLYHTAR